MATTTASARALTWLAGPLPSHRARKVLLASAVAFGAVLGAVLTLGTPSLRTSDDAEMMAAVSGYDGGTRRPELLFTSVLIGRVLVALYDLVPGAPWYGLYLHGLQLVALMTIAVSLGVLLRGAPRAVAVAVAATLLLTAANAMMAVQFTIVGILLAISSGFALLALRVTHRSAILAGTLCGALLWLSFLVRVQAFGLGLLLVGLLGLLLGVSRRRAELLAWTVALGVAGTLIGTATAMESKWWSEVVGAPRPIPIWSSGLESTSSTPAREERPRLTENDRELISNWLIWPEQMFMFDSDGPSRSRDREVRDPTPAADSSYSLSGFIARFAGAAPDLIRTSWPMLIPALALIAVAADRRRSIVSASILASGMLLLAAVASTRLPDRVAVPMLFGILASVATGVAVHDAQSPVTRDRRSTAAPGPSRTTALLLAVLIVMPPQLAAVAQLSEEATWRRERAERFLDELAALPDDPTVVLWLIDSWHALHPLGWDEAAKYPVDAVQLAGWQFVLPYREQQRRDLGLTDWVAAVADRQDVLLVAEEERVELLRTLLRERRGRLCTEVDVMGTVREGRELLVRGFDDIPCQGALIDP